MAWNYSGSDLPDARHFPRRPCDAGHHGRDREYQRHRCPIAHLGKEDDFLLLHMHGQFAEHLGVLLHDARQVALHRGIDAVPFGVPRWEHPRVAFVAEATVAPDVAQAAPLVPAVPRDRRAAARDCRAGLGREPPDRSGGPRPGARAVLRQPRLRFRHQLRGDGFVELLQGFGIPRIGLTQAVPQLAQTHDLDVSRHGSPASQCGIGC